MKYPNSITHSISLFTIAFFAITIGNFSNLSAAEQPQGSNPTSGKTFNSPDDAIQALRAAAETKDNVALRELFGPQFTELLTGDKVQDAHNAMKFSDAISAGINQVKDADDKITLEIGTNNWPMPIPLVKADGQWHFDTAAGKEEIINRHIGKDELTAIGVCKAYVAAQKQFADQNHGTDGQVTYALKFKSSEGKRDGLYWPATDGSTSPFGPLVAEAHAEGYTKSHDAHGPHPFHGYYFHILKGQGDGASGGKMSYLANGKLTRGFALIAYPEHYDQSGVMTFIVNQDGKIYQRDLGENTLHLAREIKEYNPDGQWTGVQDEGIPDAALEK